MGCLTLIHYYADVRRPLFRRHHHRKVNSGQTHVVLAVGDNVLEPAVVVVDRVGGERGQLDTLLGQLIVLQCEAADLSRAHGREVLGVAEEDRCTAGL